MNTRNPQRQRASGAFDPLEPPPRAVRPMVAEWNESQACPECPADGAACDRSDGDCEVCGRSAVIYS